MYLQLGDVAVPTLSGAALIRLRRLLKKSLEEMRCYHSAAQVEGLGHYLQSCTHRTEADLWPRGERNFGAECLREGWKMQVDRAE